MNTIKLDRDEGKVFLKADSEGLLIVSSGGWSVPIDPEIANNYIKNYDRNDNHKNNINYGFYSTDSGVTLTHGGAKIAFTNAEFDVIESFIETAERELW
ncbi:MULTISPECIES: hypothetical protein [Idiomarina]|jgi:hypothetical protein|uniref:Uncharacterized protein n=1 Tax=Idiomarina loihiensis (strain ATCC BAA-735 / DSM 15497 / L2-TR) TaxID=283942 RepID=Q5QZF9_IDILO|nr:MULTISPECIES: hypothetical protein [Idiomarina]AAV83436.1 Hypothetical protein IL2604 [Idiomarina loihiensis L2TR]AGM37480.1 hypothetical protein K734_13105 [Idiomarina loihiensis GSL 199]MBF39430.1 hypothetical protein [Idiomarinaceae bacterium]|tara:strand:+ start:19599 stop:19895 length:297 start_codon:yes stop_codon:yes gene_type:complete